MTPSICTQYAEHCNVFVTGWIVRGAYQQRSVSVAPPNLCVRTNRGDGGSAVRWYTPNPTVETLWKPCLCLPEQVQSFQARVETLPFRWYGGVSAPEREASAGGVFRLVRVQVRRYVRARSMDVGFGTQLLRGAGGVSRGVLQSGGGGTHENGHGIRLRMSSGANENRRIHERVRVCMSLAKDGKRGTEARPPAGARRRVATSTRARSGEEKECACDDPDSVATTVATSRTRERRGDCSALGKGCGDVPVATCLPKIKLASLRTVT